MSNGFEFAVGLLNLVLLCVLLKFIVIKPMIKVAKDREESVKKTIDEAENLYQEACKQRDRYQELTQNLETEKKELLAKAERQANDIKAEGAKVAAREAEELVNKANRESAGARKSVSADIRAKMAAATVAKAQEILTSKLDDEVHRNIVEKFLVKIGGSHAK